MKTVLPPKMKGWMDKWLDEQKSHLDQEGHQKKKKKHKIVRVKAAEKLGRFERNWLKRLQGKSNTSFFAIKHGQAV